MHADQPDPAPAPDADPTRVDPEGMKGAHARTGRLLKHAGLPFEDDEFDDDDDDGNAGSAAPSDAERGPGDL